MSTETVWIDSAPLVASPEPTGTLRECEVLSAFHAAGDKPAADRLYLAPINPPGSPLYVSRSWVRRPSCVIEIAQCFNDKWSYFPEEARDILGHHEGEIDTWTECLELARADRSIPRGAGFRVVRRLQQTERAADPSLVADQFWPT